MLVVPGQRQGQVAVHPALDAYIQPPVKIQTRQGGYGDDEVIHVYPCLLSVGVMAGIKCLYRR
ncbi:hypothetical protein D3C78_1941920 [compost metagenome]